MLANYTGAGRHPRSGIAFFDQAIGNMVNSDSADYQPSDQDILYRFNSIGYRGSDFDPFASLRIFACGCSYTFGMGVADRETWPRHLLASLETRHGLAPLEWELQNFSQIGASNRYIARTIVEQCALARPDLAVVMFTHCNRIEYLEGERIENLGAWDLEVAPTLLTPGQRFFAQYNDAVGSLDLLRNMWLVQSFLQSRGIAYVLAWIDIENFDSLRGASNPAIRELAEQIDVSRLIPVSIKQRDVMVDVSQGHPGRQSHSRFAAELMRFLDGSQTSADLERAMSRRTHDETSFRKVRHCDSRTTRLDPGTATRFEDEESSTRAERTASASRRSVTKRWHRVSGHESSSATLREFGRICAEGRATAVLVEWPPNGGLDQFIGGSHVAPESIEPDSRNDQLVEQASLVKAFLTPELRVADLLIDVLTAQFIAESAGITYRFLVPIGVSLFPPVNAALRSLASTLDMRRVRLHETEPMPVTGMDRLKGIRRKIRDRLFGARSPAREEDPNIYPLW